MKKNKRFLAVSLALIMVMGILAACAPAATPDAGVPGAAPAAPAVAAPPAELPPEGGEAMGGFVGEVEEGANLARHIDIVLSEELVVVNPTLPAGNGAAPTWSHRLLHDRLLDQPEPGVFVGALATEWETDDFQTWRFHLRNDVTWHNGDHFTAECVRFTVENALANPGTLAWNRWRDVAEAVVVDTYTVDLILVAPNVDIFFELANHGGASILNQRAFNENPDDPMWASVGTGPFRVVNFVSSSFMTLERFDDYWGEMPPTESLTLWSVPEQATRAVMLQNGEVQLAFGLAAEDLNRFEAEPDFQLFSSINVSPTSLSFNNMGNELMMDRYFRLALAHGINTADVAYAHAGRWAMAPWDGNVWGAGVQYRLEGLPKREHNPDLAREYLSRSVYNGEAVLLAMIPPTIAGEVIQMQLAAIGVNIEIDTMDLPSLVGGHTYDPNSDHNVRQLHLFGIAANPSALRTLRTGFYPGSATNRLNYSNPVVTELIRTMAGTDDEQIRRNAVYQIQEILYEEIPAIPVFFTVTGVVAIDGIGGVVMGNDPFATCMRNVFLDMG